MAAKTHFGALLKRSAVDLAACFISDVEEALNKGRLVAALFLDIKGAFDTVTYTKLLSRLRLQGWPPWLVNWVNSFVIEREIKISYGGEVLEPAEP